MEYQTMTLFTVPGKQKLLKQGGIAPYLQDLLKSIPKSHS